MSYNIKFLVLFPILSILSLIGPPCEKTYLYNGFILKDPLYNSYTAKPIKVSLYKTILIGKLQVPTFIFNNHNYDENGEIIEFAHTSGTINVIAPNIEIVVYFYKNFGTYKKYIQSIHLEKLENEFVWKVTLKIKKKKNIIIYPIKLCEFNLLYKLEKKYNILKKNYINIKNIQKKQENEF